MSDQPTTPFIPQAAGSDGSLPEPPAGGAPAANPGGATVGQPPAAPVTTPVASTSGTAWLVWLVCGVVAVALLAAGGWALTRNRAPRSDLQPADTPEGPDGAGSGPQPETAGQAVGRPEGRTGQGEDSP